MALPFRSRTLGPFARTVNCAVNWFEAGISDSIRTSLHFMDVRTVSRRIQSRKCEVRRFIEIAEKPKVEAAQTEEPDSAADCHQ